MKKACTFRLSIEAKRKLKQLVWDRKFQSQADVIEKFLESEEFEAFVKKTSPFRIDWNISGQFSKDENFRGTVVQELTDKARRASENYYKDLAWQIDEALKTSETGKEEV